MEFKSGATKQKYGRSSVVERGSFKGPSVLSTSLKVVRVHYRHLRKQHHCTWIAQRSSTRFPATVVDLTLLVRSHSRPGWSSQCVDRSRREKGASTNERERRGQDTEQQRGGQNAADLRRKDKMTISDQGRLDRRHLGKTVTNLKR